MPGNPEPTTTVGRLRVSDGAGVVRIEQRYDVDAAGLWSALTDPVQLVRWYGHVRGELREGGEFRVRIDGPDIDNTGRVPECRPPSSLRVRTRETEESARRGDGLPFDTTIDVALAPDRAHPMWRPAGPSRSVTTGGWRRAWSRGRGSTAARGYARAPSRRRRNRAGAR